ncbi:histidinol-phosphate transaminase [Neisseriaceae bacterium ESL0693]|nr:histidinol-phosphate transaminase [Neisseriaceae bacterium ESL0693]
MSQFWSEVVQQLVPYTPGEQPKMQQLTKLNTNENPFPPSPHALGAMQAAINDDLRLYPDPEATQLKQTIAGYYGLHENQVFVGNGSDEILAHTFATFFQGRPALLMPDVTYSFYPVYCQLYQVAPRIIPLSENFTINPADYTGAKAGVLLPNPNAPTGIVLTLAQIEQILQANPQAVVVIDEAYIDFGGTSAVSLIQQYPNLLVIQTLSKSRSLAGMRVGFAMGQAHLIEGLQRVKNSFNSYPLDRVAQAGAMAAIKDEDYFQQTRHEIMANRSALVQQLTAMGFNVLPSMANFIFACHPEYDAAQLARQLHDKGVIVRHFKQPRINQFLRITIGTQSQHERLIAVLTQLIH